MIKLSLREMNEHGAIWLSGELNLN